MLTNPVLVVMAAGMGSRYGGLKQIDPMGSYGESILDYSLYDAYRAGFRRAVIIIKEAIRADFMETVGKRLASCPLEITYAYQELTKLPEGFSVPEGRVKPFGTGHAILCARDAIGDAPFVAINADDFYGRSSFEAIFKALSTAPVDEKAHYYMVGYYLRNTLSENGSVARGICVLNENHTLHSLTERTAIEPCGDQARFPVEDGKWEYLPLDTVVSMNMFGFPAAFLGDLQHQFEEFLVNSLAQNTLKAEFYLPIAVNAQMQAGKAVVHVLSTDALWYGVTHAADKPVVTQAIAQMCFAGEYPQPLWK